MEVVMRMLRMETVQKEALEGVERTLKAEFMSNLARANRRDSHEVMAEIFNNLDRAAEGRIMAALEERNRESAERIRALMFTFDDLAAPGRPRRAGAAAQRGEGQAGPGAQGRQRAAAGPVLPQPVRARGEDAEGRHRRRSAPCGCATWTRRRPPSSPPPRTSPPRARSRSSDGQEADGGDERQPPGRFSRAHALPSPGVRDLPDLARRACPSRRAAPPPPTIGSQPRGTGRHAGRRAGAGVPRAVPKGSARVSPRPSVARGALDTAMAGARRRASIEARATRRWRARDANAAALAVLLLGALDAALPGAAARAAAPDMLEHLVSPVRPRGRRARRRQGAARPA